MRLSASLRKVTRRKAPSVYVWLSKTKQESGTCKICSTDIAMKHFSTSNLIFHLKRHHGFLKKYNAWKIYEELSGIKEDRLNKLKRKNSEIDTEAQPVSKQPKIFHDDHQKANKSSSDDGDSFQLSVFYAIHLL